MELHLVHNDWCVDENDVMTVIGVEVLFVPVMLQSAGCIFCRTMEGRATILEASQSTLMNEMRAILRLEPLLASELFIFGTKHGPMGSRER